MPDCSFPGCSRIAQSNGYCVPHSKYGAPVAKKIKEIPKRSEKMKGIINELKKLYALFLARPENKYCKVKINEGCTKVATTIHHVRGREGEQVFEQKDWLSACSHCNVVLESKDALAREKGVKKSKHQVQD